MRLCSYVVVTDMGFAPNPFGGYCTLAACTPNRQGIKMEAGDWLVGHSNLDAGQRLVYAMRISEVLDFDDYYHDPRFAAKKPGGSQTWMEACGDNIYHRAADGSSWIKDPSPFHNEPSYLQKDTRHPRVFVSEHFYYFGENAPPIPAQFSALIRDRQGCRCDYPSDLAESFIDWLQNNHSPGLHGEPRDRQVPGRICRSTPVEPGNNAARRTRQASCDAPERSS